MSVLVKYEGAMEEVSLEWLLSDVSYTVNKSVCFKTDAFLLLPRIKNYGLLGLHTHCYIDHPEFV